MSLKRDKVKNKITSISTSTFSILIPIFQGKIEEFALKARYGEQFLNYASEVPFMFPFFKIKRIKIEKD